MEEIWKNIEGYPNYQVSNMGRVKSLEKTITYSTNNRWGECECKRFCEEKILKNYLSKRGYYVVNLSQNGKSTQFKVHTLVAQAFISNPDNKPQIDHINTIRTDNRVENLRWVTNKENMNNPITTKKCSINNNMRNKIGKNHPNSKPVLQFTKDDEFIREWENAVEVSKFLNINRICVYNCCSGKYKTAGNYVWKYAYEYERIPFKVFDLEIYRRKAS